MLKLLALGGLISIIPCLAMANVGLGDNLGTSLAEIRTALAARGYQIDEIEFDDDKIEIELIKDGMETELVLSVTTGKVTEIEIEDSD